MKVNFKSTCILFMKNNEARGVAFASIVVDMILLTLLIDGYEFTKTD